MSNTYAAIEAAKHAAVALGTSKLSDDKWTENYQTGYGDGIEYGFDAGYLAAHQWVRIETDGLPEVDEDTDFQVTCDYQDGASKPWVQQVTFWKSRQRFSHFHDLVIAYRPAPEPYRVPEHTPTEES